MRNESRTSGSGRGGEKPVAAKRYGARRLLSQNVPSKTNPRTSQLAAFSALATLANLTRSLRVGT
jgi:predicted dinucleotide-utilizing enzyme